MLNDDYSLAKPKANKTSANASKQTDSRPPGAHPYTNSSQDPFLLQVQAAHGWVCLLQSRPKALAYFNGHASPWPWAVLRSSTARWHECASGCDLTPLVDQPDILPDEVQQQHRAAPSGLLVALALDSMPRCSLAL